MNKTILAAGIAAVVLGGALAYPKFALAYRGDPAIHGPNYSEERHQAMEKAFETNDYAAWKSLMQSRGRVTQIVNQSNFSQFAKAHELAEEGKIQEANAIREQLGLRNGNCQGSGMNRWNR